MTVLNFENLSDMKKYFFILISLTLLHSCGYVYSDILCAELNTNFYYSSGRSGNYQGKAETSLIAIYHGDTVSSEFHTNNCLYLIGDIDSIAYNEIYLKVKKRNDYYLFFEKNGKVVKKHTRRKTKYNKILNEFLVPDSLIFSAEQLNYCNDFLQNKWDSIP